MSKKDSGAKRKWFVDKLLPGFILRGSFVVVPFILVALPNVRSFLVQSVTLPLWVIICLPIISFPIVITSRRFKKNEAEFKGILWRWQESIFLNEVVNVTPCCSDDGTELTKTPRVSGHKQGWISGEPEPTYDDFYSCLTCKRDFPYICPEDAKKLIKVKKK